MATECPDIISEYLVARERYECEGVQIVPSLEPAQIPLGGHGMLVFLLQNAMSAAAELLIKPELPVANRPKGAPLFELGEPVLHAHLEPAQVGSLCVPLRTTPHTRPGPHEIRFNLAVKLAAGGTRVRPTKTAGRFKSTLIDDVVGLDLGRVLGVPYSIIPTRKFSLPITVSDQAAASTEKPYGAARFESLWTLDQLERQSRAQQLVNMQRQSILAGLQTEALYARLLAEAQQRFSQAGVILHIGEAIALGKILTYTVCHFLSNPDLQDGLLVPIYEAAAEYDLPQHDPVWILRNIGFSRVLRLSIALSFGLAAQVLKRQPWDVEERRGLIQVIPERLEAGERLPIELLYIPLLIGAALVSYQIVMDGEDVGHSLRLLQQAKASRAEVFNDPDLAEASRVFDNVLKAMLSQAR